MVEKSQKMWRNDLMELAERCMIQVRKRDITTFKIKRIHKHDLMRDLCLSKAKQESFVFIVDQSNASSSSMIRKVRRASSQKSLRIQCIKSPNLLSLLFFNGFSPDEETEKLFPNILLNYIDNHEDNLNKLRLIFESLLVCDTVPVAVGVLFSKAQGAWRYMCNNFKLLRVLNYKRRLDNEVIAGRKLPNDIGNLIHLRFLSLRGIVFWWRKLPSSLGNLRCLLTLDLRLGNKDSQSIHVPNVIWKMKKLRHLYLPLKYNSKTKLKLGTLRNLQTLVNFNTKSCYLKDLMNVTNLRELAIKGPFEIEDFNVEELEKNPPVIEGKYLYSLSIIDRGGRIDMRQLNHLLSSCISLCKLCLDVKINELPKYNHLSSNLAYIKLSYYKVDDDPMPTLEKLPNLRILKLLNVALRANKIVYSAQGSPKLESLRLKQLFNLEE
ncbi:CC-NBS-LRR class disease resistance protein [Hibiscus syriacus]|uniref:CC-NBS-LRR class disease resistance protein n=1 Tax=Hibiscus syriacus TaxID=106335 RepID=A0A6A2Y6Y6_HIBSY|nr:CC-NBS-LRR class disease resistance protein [Hibiscus syriacus]